MGKYGQSYGQISTTNNFTKLFVYQLIVEVYRATLLLIKRGGIKPRRVSLFLLESFLTKLISNSLKNGQIDRATGRKTGKTWAWEMSNC